MLFNSPAFLLFFAIFFALYAVTRGTLRVAIVLLASNIFYAAWDWRFLGLIWLSTLINYVSALRRDSPVILRAAIAANLALLGFFKYFNFFVGSATASLQALGLPVHEYSLSIILPIGISFYTFHSMSYVIDVHRGEMRAERNLLYFATYVTLFPQLIAGPIVRAKSLLPQIRSDPDITWAGLAAGAELVLWGYVLKLCLADNAAPYVNLVFASSGLATPMANLLAVLSFALQIYGDFAGYSLIAIGIGRMMGLDFGKNFDAPYFATSFGGFWRRWHISLSTWLRDYLFIPLGGSRGSRVRTFRNILVTMFLGGLWHGASWVFVVWGLLHGAYLVLERLIAGPLQAVARTTRLPRWLSDLAAMATVFSLTCLAWLFFRAPTLGGAMEMLRSFLAFGDYGVSLGSISPQLPRTVLMALLVFTIDALGRSNGVRAVYRSSAALRLGGAYLMFMIILLFGSFSGHQFIYFQF